MQNDLRNKILEEGKAIEIKDGFFLFHTLSPARQEGETYEEYVFRRKVTKKAMKKYFKR